MIMVDFGLRKPQRRSGNTIIIISCHIHGQGTAGSAGVTRNPVPCAPLFQDGTQALLVTLVTGVDWTQGLLAHMTGHVSEGHPFQRELQGPGSRLLSPTRWQSQEWQLDGLNNSLFIHSLQTLHSARHHQ